jgi:hypothetical protein
MIDEMKHDPDPMWLKILAIPVLALGFLTLVIL